MGEEVAEALRARVPPEDAAEDDFPPAFRRIAELLLDRAIWHVGGRDARQARRSARDVQRSVRGG